MELTMGNRIRFVRQFRGLTQTELAEKVGLPPGENGRIRIFQYENGTHVPKEEMLEKMITLCISAMNLCLIFWRIGFKRKRI